jgi:hypothetical protein
LHENKLGLEKKRSPTSARAFYIPFNKLCPPAGWLHPGRAISLAEVDEMAPAAQARASPISTDSVQRWLARRGAGAPPNEPGLARAALRFARIPQKNQLVLEIANTAWRLKPVPLLESELWNPADHGFVFSKELIQRHAQQLMRNNPAPYATLRPFQAVQPPTGATI